MIEDPRNPSAPPPTSKVNQAIAILDSKINKTDDIVINKLQFVRKRLTGSFQRDILINEIKKLVDVATFTRFADDRAKKFIDPHRPVLRLRVKLNGECFQNFPNPKLETLIKANKPISMDPETQDGRNNINLFMRQKMDVLNAEVMEPFLTFMFENLQKLQEANEEVKKELEEIFTLMPDIKDLKQFLLPSIFRVMSDPTKAELIQMEYLS